LLSSEGGSFVSRDAAEPSTGVCDEEGVLAAILQIENYICLTRQHNITTGAIIMPNFFAAYKNIMA
jgi:hypothetical protein